MVETPNPLMSLHGMRPAEIPLELSTRPASSITRPGRAVEQLEQGHDRAQAEEHDGATDQNFTSKKARARIRSAKP
jgi:hypothetical protein